MQRDNETVGMRSALIDFLDIPATFCGDFVQKITLQLAVYPSCGFAISHCWTTHTHHCCFLLWVSQNVINVIAVDVYAET